ncbi:MAG: alpha/beta hydrolase [Pyrinomonadaceae bacterium]|nr:alpha/beta hydrolase [Pyrinomonadaceae bacterium]MCX7640935.1 alpha/beta hydrolase [Pyrinomonadaceae bacterium]MDW8304717.1 alpha/beta hydrolase [Acidobacteriota bacterium]
MKRKSFLIGVGIGFAGGLALWKILSKNETVDKSLLYTKFPHADKSNFLLIDGIRVHYQRFGEERCSKKVILIHGYNSSVYVWKTVAPMLAEKGLDVIAVDMVGFGFSDKPSWFDYSIQAQGRMLVRMMDRLNIGKATLIGSSYGGAVAALTALDYPERVEKLVLISAVSNDKPLSHPLMKLARVPFLGEIVSMLLVDSKRFIKWRMKKVLSPANYDLINDEQIEKVRIPLVAKDSHKAIVNTARKWQASRIEREASLIPHKTLIIWGEDDKVIDISEARKLYEEILHSRLVVFKNCGHVPQEEKPEEFANVVTEFIFS